MQLFLIQDLLNKNLFFNFINMLNLQKNLKITHSPALWCIGFGIVLFLFSCGRNDNSLDPNASPFFGRGYEFYIEPDTKINKKCMMDFYILTISSDQETILSAYVGNHPDFPRKNKSNDVSNVKINNFDGKCLTIHSKKNCLITLSDNLYFPNYIHFIYETKNLQKAEKIIYSLRESFQNENNICERDIPIPPINQAALKNNFKMVKELAKTNDLNSLYLNMAPLHTAILNGNEMMAKFLIENGAKVNFTDRKSGDTPLHYVGVENRGENLAKLLVRSGAKIESKNSAGYSPLTVAVQNLNFEVTNFLLDNNANPNTRDNTGNTPLHHVVISKYGNPNKKFMIAKLLVKSGADVHLKNQEGVTALEIAKKNKFKKIASLLEEKN